MTSPTIAIIGAGNMGASLLGGLIKTGLSPAQLWITDPTTEKLHSLQQQFHVHVTEHNQDAVELADVIIFAVKPQIMETVTQSLSHLIQMRKPLIISIAAGIREKSLQNWLGKHIAIVRCMPNTPALICAGASALHANSVVTAAQRDLAESILRTVSTTVWLENEEQMDAVTALSGSGPAYFFLVIEALQKAGKTLGLSSNIAQLLTLQTAFGAARMALESKESIVELRKRVTSPGGTTEAAISVLEAAHIRELFAKALDAAQKRSAELAKQFDH